PRGASVTVPRQAAAVRDARPPAAARDRHAAEAGVYAAVRDVDGRRPRTHRRRGLAPRVGGRLDRRSCRPRRADRLARRPRALEPAVGARRARTFHAGARVTTMPIAAPALPTRRLQATHGWRGQLFAELWRYRELLYFFVWRDIKVRYK